MYGKNVKCIFHCLFLEFNDFYSFFFNVIHLLHQNVVLKTENIGKVKSSNKDYFIHLFNISQDMSYNNYNLRRRLLI